MLLDKVRRHARLPKAGMTWRSELQIPLGNGRVATGSLAGPAARDAAPPILFVPEDSLAKDALFYPELTERLLGAGFAVAMLDRPAGDAADLAFELAASRAFVDLAAAGSVDPRLARGRVGLVGHGLGAAIALLAAPDDGTVPGAVLLGCVATLDRGGDRPRREFADEVRSDPDRYSLERAVRAFPGSLVLVHGEEDHLIPIDEAERLYHWASKDRTRFVVMEKVGHSFGAQHPFVGTTKEVDRIGKILVDFFHGLMG